MVVKRFFIAVVITPPKPPIVLPIPKIILTTLLNSFLIPTFTFSGSPERRFDTTIHRPLKNWVVPITIWPKPLITKPKELSIQDLLADSFLPVSLNHVPKPKNCFSKITVEAAKTASAPIPVADTPAVANLPARRAGIAPSTLPINPAITTPRPAVSAGIKVVTAPSMVNCKGA